ncbi:apolipoprotein D-like [Lytechinus pictus]|uniref:apolipoprotein D-like n=1 Tax=Lytechinus pictus TaxID=7653 RepID=UPI0030BA2406
MAALRLIVCVVLLSLVISQSTSYPVGSLFGCFGSPQTVNELDVPAYLGRWYQVYTDLVVNVTFERNAQCVTADYGLNPDGSISVFNANTVGTPDGRFNTISGKATVPDASEPGQLVVEFPGVPAPGEYWVLKLGPIVDGKYQYAVVSDSRKVTLFVLARDAAAFMGSDDRTEVLEFLRDTGFSCFWNKPQETYQSDQCEYVQP